MGSCPEYWFMSFKFSTFALSLHASVMLTLSFDKVCRGNPTWDMIERSFITSFHVFLLVPSWLVFILAFHIESVRIYSPFYFLHLYVISAFWMMLLLITALQFCWISFAWVFNPSLHPFFLCSFAACSLVIKILICFWILLSILNLANDKWMLCCLHDRSYDLEVVI